MEKKEREQGPWINYSTYLENILPNSSLMKPEISVLSFNQGSHAPPGCLFAASKPSTDAVNNFINWKSGFCKSSGPIWLIWNWMGCLVIKWTYDPASIPHNSSHLWQFRSKRMSPASEGHGKRQERDRLILEMRTAGGSGAEHESGSLLTVLWIH